MLDLRTQEGRYARDICDGIAADLGGALNAAQQILCQIFALKVLRIQLLVPTILTGESVNQRTENYCLAWMNSARRDLQALGVLDSPSGNDALFNTHPADMTDEQLDAALALIERRQPGLSCSEENRSGEIEPARERSISPATRQGRSGSPRPSFGQGLNAALAVPRSGERSEDRPHTASPFARPARRGRRRACDEA